MPDKSRSVADPEVRLEEAIVAFLERQERGEEPNPDEWQHDPGARTVLEEMVADEKALEAWFSPLAELARSASVGRSFGNYELEQPIGTGGQGSVYRARQIHINKEVALKLVNPHDHRRSLRELELAANLEHENLVRVYHVGEHDGQLYFTMQLAEKGALADSHDVVGQDYRLPADPVEAPAERQAVAERKKKIACFMARIARAVHYLHEQGIIHRDLKPRNILLDTRGEPLVADLGLARRVGDTREEGTGEQQEDAAGTCRGAIIGTPGYMSPEQAQGLTDLTEATDIYGLGALLYKLLTDRTPFVGTTREEIIQQTADPERLVPSPSAYNSNIAPGEELGLICLGCLAKESNRRYPSASALAEDLEHYANGEETSKRPRGWLERLLGAVIGGITHRWPGTGIDRWGEIDLWDAALNLLVNGTLYALIRTDQPPGLLWLAQLTYMAVWWWMFLTYLFRHDSLEPTERHLAMLWSGVFLGGVTLFWIYCPPFGSARASDLLAFYPPWAVLNGAAFFVVGRLYWGRYYLVGLAHFLVAILMPLRLDLAPLVYGVFTAACMTYAAVDHFRWERRSGPGAR